MDIKIDTDGDLDLTNGELSLVSGKDRAAQQIKIRLRFFFGEWFLDRRQGIPWFQLILAVKPFPLSFVTSKLRDTILGVPSITKITDLYVSPNYTTRHLSVSFVAMYDDDAPIEFKEFILP